VDKFSKIVPENNLVDIEGVEADQGVIGEFFEPLGQLREKAGRNIGIYGLLAWILISGNESQLDVLPWIYCARSRTAVW
jgi:hypothetical protein